MAGSGIPEIGVRLTAKGVQDVVAAFQRVRQEGKIAGEQSASSFGLLNTQLESLSALVPLVTVGVLVDKLISASLAARENAENIGKLAEKTGSAVGPLSALALAAHDSEVEQEAFGAALIKVARNMQDAATGAAKPKKAFADLGITLSDLREKRPDEIFVEMAQKMALLPDGAHKTQIAIALMGKSGAELLPMLKALGDHFVEATERAKRLGLYLTDDMVASARAAQDAFHEMEDMVAGAATQLNVGLMPAVAGSVDALAQLVGGAEGFRTWGSIIGHGVINITGAFIELTKWIVVGLAKFDEFLTGARKAEAEFAHQDDYATTLQARIDDDKNSANQTKMDAARATQTLAKAEYDMDNPAKAQLPKKGGGGAVGDGTTDEQRNKDQAASSAYLQSLADNELAIIKLRNSVEEAEEKRRYDAGLESLETYYDNRQKRIDAAYQAELAALARKDAAIAKMPHDTPEEKYKKKTEEAKNATARTELGIRYGGDTSANTAEKSAAVVAQREKQLEIEKQLLEMSGQKDAAEEKGLDIEIEKYEQLLRTQSKSVDEIAAASDAARTMGQNKIDFETNLQSVQQQLQDMDQQIGAINDLVANGSMTEVQGQAQIHDLQARRIADLTIVVDLMKTQAALSKSTTQVAQVNALAAGLNHVKVSLQDVTTAQTYLLNQFTGQGKQDVENFFTALGDGSKSFSDSIKDLADEFEEMVSRMVAKLLIFYALEAILGWVNPAAGSSLAGLQETMKTAGPFGKYAYGGWTGGKAGEAAGIVHGEEFVVKAGPAAANLPLLEAINAGMNLPALVPISRGASVSGYSHSMAAEDNSGGAGGTGGPAPIVQVINGTGQPTQQKQTTGSNGQSITQIIIGTVRKSLASGGDLDKQMQTQYGVSRVGTMRG